ncbi:hypothetical protein [Neisseria sp.]|uniref:hypothetical protein n=1 Tax=Neisseria sp. TaxID=192066 RepID=UPI00359FE65B
MQYEFDVPPPTVADYMKGAQMATNRLLKQDKKHRRIKIFAALVPLAAYISFIIFITLYEEHTHTSTISFVTFLIGWFLACIIFLAINRTVPKTIYRRSIRTTRPCRFYADAQGFRQVYPENLFEERYSWAAVTAVEPFGSNVMLHLGISLILLPRAAFTDEAQQQQFIADARQWRENNGSLLQPDAI